MRTFRPNNYRVDGDRAYLALTRGLETVLDPSDLDIALRYRWHASPNHSGGFYAMSKRRANAEGPGTLYLHRILMSPDGRLQVDHFNHDTLDNRRSNLRIATNQQNGENRDGAYRSNQTGIRGISITRRVSHAADGPLRKDGRPRAVRYYYRAELMREYRLVAVRLFPYTPEGLQQADAWLSEQRAQHMPFATPGAG